MCAGEAYDASGHLRWRQVEPQRRIALIDYREHLLDERTAVLSALGVSEVKYEAAAARFWAPPSDSAAPRAGWDARQSLQSLVNIAVCLVKPHTMVETGVARGYTTAVALAAMRDNGVGRLYSVDLPALEYEGRAAIGDVIPAEFRSRWELELGPSRTILRSSWHAWRPSTSFSTIPTTPTPRSSASIERCGPTCAGAGCCSPTTFTTRHSSTSLVRWGRSPI